jgi:hypothetical protein
MANRRRSSAPLPTLVSLRYCMCFPVCRRLTRASPSWISDRVCNRRSCLPKLVAHFLEHMPRDPRRTWRYIWPAKSRFSRCLLSANRAGHILDLHVVTIEDLLWSKVDVACADLNILLDPSVCGLHTRSDGMVEKAVVLRPWPRKLAS